jgi:formate dehydrogenase major subunit
MGSNFAEAHPVGFRFVMKARERGAPVIHVDPRFTRTSAMSTLHVAIRAGSDIAFLGGLVNHVVNSERWNRDPFFKTYVTHYTNAPMIVREGYEDASDTGGRFSGWRPEHGYYDPSTWEYEGVERTFREAGPDDREAPPDEEARTARILSSQAWSARAGRTKGSPRKDETLEHPRCVFQILKRHYARYTPEMVERVCGVPRERFLAVADALLENSGRDKTSAIAYAVGWTQHTVGPQIIATAAILQLLLGNIGRPGGGIQALRGHATIQGSTDIPTLYDLLPGYLYMPAAVKIHDNLDDYLWNESASAGIWAQSPAFMISLLKAWYGDEATPENEFGYHLLPRVNDDHSHLPTFVNMHAGKIEGYLLMGQNPAVGGQNAGFQREALSRLDWLVVRDLFLTESATFWKDSPEVRRGQMRTEHIGTEVFVLPGATVPEKDGSFTNTQRLIQWHHKAIEPPGAARSETWFMYHLGRRLKALYAASRERRDRGIQALTWDYPTRGPLDEPEVEYVLREINGYTWAPTWEGRRQLETYEELATDGSTAAGCWIYTGVHPGFNHAASREKGDGYVAPRWAFAWPANIRLLYNRCSADPEGRPWSEGKKYLWWDEGQGRWLGKDHPDIPAAKRPDTREQQEKGGLEALAGDAPFVVKPDGKAWLFFPIGMKDGPLPTHYEPWESPVRNLLHPGQDRNPTAKHWDVVGNAYHGIDNPDYPYVFTTYRLTEHHTGGAMTRSSSWLGELQPAAFVELSPELAESRGVRPGEWVTVVTARGETEGRALVTRRMRPLTIDGRTVHQVGMPWHFGYEGLVRGGSANDVIPLVADPNVTIHEGKVSTCNIRPGRAREGHRGNGERP